MKSEIMCNEEDNKFIEEIYIGYFPIMYKTALEIVKNDDLAHDIVHNSICKLYGKISLLKTFEPRLLISYIVITVKNTSLDFLKSPKNKMQYCYSDEYESENQASLKYNPEEYLIEIEDYEGLVRRIINLPEKKKNLLYMKYILDMDMSQISKTTGIPISNLYVQFHRIKKELSKGENNIAKQ